jgi:hypothetical protein
MMNCRNILVDPNEFADVDIVDLCIQESSPGLEGSINRRGNSVVRYPFDAFNFKGAS